MKKLIAIVLVLGLTAVALFAVNITGNGTSGPYGLISGKKYAFAIDGTFDSASCSVQIQISDQWLEIPNDNNPFTAEGGMQFVAFGPNIRVVTSSAGGSTDLHFVITEVLE